MWLFTKYGFYSAVCARRGDGAHGQPIDPERVMVRARLRSHLEALQARFESLRDCELQASSDTDYAFRLFVPKAVWGDVTAALALEMDYDNFKSEVAEHQGRAGAAYEQALHDVWSVMHRLQQRDRAVSR